MRKLLSLLLVLSLLFALVACVSDPNVMPDTTPTQTTPIQTTPVQTPPKNETEDIVFSGLLAIDNSDCTVNFTGIDANNFLGYTLKVQLENKSGDKNYMFSIVKAAINGVQCDPFFAAEVAAGKKANERIIFNDTELAKNGIDKFTDIEITFRVYDSDDWSADDIAEATVHIYPYGEENATKYVRESKNTDTILVDNEYVTAIVIGYNQDDIWGYTIDLFLVNKTSQTVMFSLDNASINGFMIDPFYASEVGDNKCAFGSITWFNSALEENGIEVVEEIEFRFKAYESENWMVDDYFNEVVTLNP